MARIAPRYDPAFDTAVLWKPESGNITESEDGITPATLPAAPSAPVMAGWISNFPGLDLGLNNARGTDIGTRRKHRKKRGARNPKMAVKMKITDVNLAKKGLAAGNDALEWQCFWLVIPGKETILCRFSKVAGGNISFTETPTGEAAEVEIELNIEITAVQSVTPLDPDLDSLVAALPEPLYYHDLRSVGLTNSAGVENNYRDALMSLSFTWDNKLDRQGERQNWGDDEPLSNTNLALVETQMEVSGELKFHSNVDLALLHGVANAQDWGAISALVSNRPVLGDEDGIAFLFTATDTFPSNATRDAAEANSQLSTTVPFTGSDFTITDVEVEEED